MSVEKSQMGWVLRQNRLSIDGGLSSLFLLSECYLSQVHDITYAITCVQFNVALSSSWN